MIALYNSMGGPNWKNNANWLSDNPIGDWHGITTNNRGRIIKISPELQWPERPNPTSVWRLGRS